VGADLKESYVKQAVDYAANQGVDWVVLTNGTIWQIYKSGSRNRSLVSSSRLRRLSPDVRVDADDVRRVLENEVVKRDALEGERAVAARRSVTRAANKALRQTRETAIAQMPEAVPPTSEALPLVT
jgi:predicted type IV restriction endonuclease